jgi:hypothetical protein
MLDPSLSILLERVDLYIHCEANYHENEAEKYNRASLGGSIGDVRRKDCQKGGSDVNRNCHELRFARGVSQILDNCRKEETNAIQRADDLSCVSSS